MPQGAEEADGADGLAGQRVPDREGRRLDQGLRGLRMGKQRGGRPTFTVGELRTLIVVAAAAAATSSPMRDHRGNAPSDPGGVETIEHGDGGTAEVLRLMAEGKSAVPHARRGRRDCRTGMEGRSGADAAHGPEAGH